MCAATHFCLELTTISMLKEEPFCLDGDNVTGVT